MLSVRGWEEPGVRRRNASKERYWETLMGRRDKSGETVAQFCRRVGVPVHQFYWWQRKLRSREQLARPAGRTDERAQKPAAEPFLPVRLPLVAQASAPIEVIHPGGCVVRVPAGFDPLVLRHILRTLDPSTSDSVEC